MPSPTANIAAAKPLVSGVILAAGTSSRLGRPKQLLDLGGEPSLRHVIQAALASRLMETIVVLGNEAEIVRQAVGELGQRTVVNHRFAEGQSTSLICGIEAVGTDAEAAMLLLGDQPLLRTGTINAVLDAFVGSRASVVQARRDDYPSHPVLIRRTLFSELLALTGDEGARSILRRHAYQTEFVDVPDVDEALDLDTEADYERMREAWRRQPERTR